jgi:hypothetical protein
MPKTRPLDHSLIMNPPVKHAHLKLTHYRRVGVVKRPVAPAVLSDLADVRKYGLDPSACCGTWFAIH